MALTLDAGKLCQVQEKLEQVEDEMYKQFAAVKNISSEGELVNIECVSRLMSFETSLVLFGYKNIRLEGTTIPPVFTDSNSSDTIPS